MDDRKWNSVNESDFDRILESSLADLPPEDIVAEVTPWKTAMNRILIGMALSTITLNFLCLNYILPTVGIVLSLLGFRALRCENKWFKACFIITVFRVAYQFSALILNTTILQSTVYESSFMSVLTAVHVALLFLLFICFGSGLRTVQHKAQLPPSSGGATALILWYAVVCLLAAVQYSGFVIAGALLVAYIFIIRSLFKLSKVLDEAGYAVQTVPVRVTDRAIVVSLLAVLLIGCVCGYLCGGSYPMDWTAADRAEHSEVAATKSRLLELGFPEKILADVSASDIAACENALQVVVEVKDRALDPSNGTIRFTGVAVRLPGEREQWRIFHHFQWISDPGFYGTECIQLWPAYQHGNGWGSAGDVSGRVLYDRDGETYLAPYYFLGNQTFTSNSLFQGNRTSTDLFAAFSMPRKGENHRGYLSYPIYEVEDGWIVDAWINYTHQKSWMQYPAMTAMEKRMAVSWNESGAFKTIQDAFQFYDSGNGAQLLGEE